MRVPGATGAAGGAPSHESGGTNRPRGGFAGALDHALRALEPQRATSVAATGELDPAAALALQASIYRDAERLELASKLLDYGVGAVKTILQTKV